MRRPLSLVALQPSHNRGFTVRALGEIALACRDIGAMEAFYADVLGLQVLSRRPDGLVFFGLRESHGGHRQVLALFPGRTTAPPIDQHDGALHHLALTIDYREQEAAMDHLRSHDLAFTVESFDWIGWRGIFVRDPEGNVVELVAAAPQPAASQ